MLKYISPAEAVEILLRLPVHLRQETVPLLDAQGRVLAKDVIAGCPVPPFARSPYDGFALRSADTLAASELSPVTLRITEEITAGALPEGPVNPGQAAKILTGAPVPEGADCVVKYEQTVFTESDVTIHAPLVPGNIVRAGEDTPAGEVAAVRGTVVNSGMLGVLAGQGYSEVSVWEKPRIAVLSTGSELTGPGVPLPPGKVYNTNFYTLGGMLRDAGADPADAGTVPDDPAAIASRIRQCCEMSDMVLVTGGASAGDYDFTRTALEMAGAVLLFHRVSCRPGGAMLAGTVHDKLALCLSGNPGAAAAGLLRVGIPYIRKLCGRRDVAPERLLLSLRRPYEKPSPHTRLVWGCLLIEEGRAFFDPCAVQGSSGISSLAQCGLLAEIPGGAPPLPAGTLIHAYRVRE